MNLDALRREYEIKRRVDVAAARSGAKRSRAKRAKEGDLLQGLAGMAGVAWTLEEEVELQREVQDIWPGWWGSVDKVGKSPYDHVPSIHGTRRILFLTGERVGASCRGGG